MIVYFSLVPARAFWTDHWAGYSVQELLGEARRSPLTALVEGALPPGGPILEAGCGLGQLVLLFRERGRQTIGVDRVFEPLRECRRSSLAAPVAVMDLRRLGIRSGAFSGYISLGVVEHDPQGPDAILCEARRVLEPGGVLILSVPCVNGVRRLAAWWIRRRNRRIQNAGGEFYQFAFSGTEARAFLERNGFRVLWARPYDPTRLFRRWTRRLMRVTPSGPARRGALEPVSAGRNSGLSSRILRLARQLLYTRAGLSLFGHMLLLTAVKAD